MTSVGLSFIRHSSLVIRHSLELGQKPQVILEEEADIVHLVLQDRHAVYAHSPRESGVALVIHPGHAQDFGVPHSRPKDLNPAALLAYAAAFPKAEYAADVHFGP